MKIKLRNLLLGDFREEVISDIITKEMQKLKNIKRKKTINIIDYGSGYNPVIIYKIINKLSLKYKKTKFFAYCYDFYSKKQINTMNVKKNIKFFHVKNIAKNKKKFDFCLVIDVLHHIGLEDNNKISQIVRKLKNKSEYLFIKDHFQFSFFSNFILMLMDFIGNYFDKVKIPRLYFDKTMYEEFIINVKLNEIKRICDVNYYKWYWIYINSKKLQFISILK